MISGIHLATALSVMLHMEQEGSGMETKELIEALRQDSEMMSDGTREGLTKAWHDEVMKDSAKDCTLAADRLSEQQQVIDELVKTLEEGAQVDTPELMEWAAERFVRVHGDSPNVDYVQSLKHRAQRIRDALSRAKGHTKEAE